ncbi:hypothetical protein FGB62_33g1111 [Gracilaria domingensis]|nr:hypothetical protein FGB62_33g1111 [Gracilaria domingensis]
MDDPVVLLQQLAAEFDQRPPFVPNYDNHIKLTALDENRVPVDNQIQAALEDLRCLKHQLTALRSKQIFLRRLRDAQSLQDLPSAQEAVTAEMRLQKKKSELRKQKAARAASEKRFENAVMQACLTAKSIQETDQLAQNHIRRLKSASYTEQLVEKMNRDEWDSVMRFFDDVAEVDKLEGSDCQQLSDMFTKERVKLEAEANRQNVEVTELQKRLNRVEQSTGECEKEIENVRHRFAKKERRDPKFANVLHEYELQKHLEQILPSITAVRVAAVQPDGILFDINASLIVPSDGKLDRRQATHTLTYKRAGFDGSNTEGLILSPPDVEIADLIDQPDSSLPIVIKEVCARLRNFMAKEQLSPTAVNKGD